MKDELSALIRARNPLIWLVTPEEARAERLIFEIAAANKYDCRQWDCVSGFTNAAGEVTDALGDPQAALTLIRDTRQRRVYVMRDLHKWLDPVTLRLLRTAYRELQAAPRNEARTIIVLSPSAEIPLELQGQCVQLTFPRPDRTQVSDILRRIITQLSDETRETATAGLDFDAAVDAAVGLTSDEAENCFAKSLVTKRRIDVGTVAAEKKRVIASVPGLSWVEPHPRGLQAIGGLDLLKKWLAERKAAFSAEARAYGLPPPKGLLAVGHPGCGKSLLAKAVPTAFGLPCIRGDIGGTKSKYVGDSEGNIRRMLAVAETIAPCVLWLDEIEKAFAGASGEQGDGGVSADAMGTFLTWQQEHVGSVFVVATANNVSKLPPELLRKGRFDEMFFVDLPTWRERVEVLRATLIEYRRGDVLMESELSDVTNDAMMIGFTGAEVAAVVPDALFQAFNDGKRAITADDIVDVTRRIVPLSKTASEKITELRMWAKGRARPASSPEGNTSDRAGRALDM